MRPPIFYPLSVAILSLTLAQINLAYNHQTTRSNQAGSPVADLETKRRTSNVEHQSATAAQRQSQPSTQSRRSAPARRGAAASAEQDRAVSAMSIEQATSFGYDQLEKGLAEQAIRAFRIVLRKDTANLNAQLGMGLAQQKAGRMAAAMVEFRKALAIDPANQTALKALGVLYSYQRPTWRKAVETLQIYLGLNPKDSDGRLYLAQVLTWIGEHSAAETHLRAVLQQRPSDSSAKLLLAQTLAWQGKGQAALPIFEELRASNALPQKAEYDYALALWQSGRLEEAEKIYLQLILNQPKNRNLKAELAKIISERDRIRSGAYTQRQLDLLAQARQLHESGQTEQAIPHYRQVLAERPSDRKLSVEFVDILASVAAHREEALQLNRRLMAESPGRDLQIQRAKILSWMPERRSEAIAWLREEFRRNPDDTEIRSLLAQSLIWSAPDPSLGALFVELLHYEPNNHELRLRYAQLLTEQNQHQLALAQAEEVLRRDSGNLEARLALARIYDAMGRTKDADAQIQFLTVKKRN